MELRALMQDLLESVANDGEREFIKDANKEQIIDEMVDLMCAAYNEARDHAESFTRLKDDEKMA